VYLVFGVTGIELGVTQKYPQLVFLTSKNPQFTFNSKVFSRIYSLLLLPLKEAYHHISVFPQTHPLVVKYQLHEKFQFLIRFTALPLHVVELFTKLKFFTQAFIFNVPDHVCQ
jgi:hypothetical protein